MKLSDFDMDNRQEHSLNIIYSQVYDWWNSKFGWFGTEIEEIYMSVSGIFNSRCYFIRKGALYNFVQPVYWQNWLNLGEICCIARIPSFRVRYRVSELVLCLNLYDCGLNIANFHWRHYVPDYWCVRNLIITIMNRSPKFWHLH